MVGRVIFALREREKEGGRFTLKWTNRIWFWFIYAFVLKAIKGDPSDNKPMFKGNSVNDMLQKIF